MTGDTARIEWNADGTATVRCRPFTRDETQAISGISPRTMRPKRIAIGVAAVVLAYWLWTDPIDPVLGVIFAALMLLIPAYITYAWAVSRIGVSTVRVDSRGLTADYFVQGLRMPMISGSRVRWRDLCDPGIVALDGRNHIVYSNGPLRMGLFADLDSEDATRLIGAMARLKRDALSACPTSASS